MQRVSVLAGLIAGFVIALIAPSMADAQVYPTKPVKLIVPFAPGGTTDIVARIFAERLGKELGQTIVVENRAGAGGAIGAAEAAKAAPDGYTLGMATVSTMAVGPATTAKPTYNNLTDFIPITNIAATPNVLVVHPSLPVKDAKEFVELLKKNPGKYSFASSGARGIGHMMGELFQLATGTDMIHIPYKGAGPAVIDVLAGTVPIFFDNLPSSKANIDAGKFKLLAVMAPKRLPAYPNVPTMGELGWGEVNDRAWYGLLAPAKTPKDIIDKLHAASVKAINAPDIREKLINNGADPVGNTPAEFADQIKAEFERAKTAVVKRKITLE
ncbi:MAG: tripartite tricarboxylate transporter substrate binding protein BugE [Betaproteobacteria bacterium]|nr:tripartite tricarboxylate transporter substrate binding protein BugE [Betaproteobacteria bacterium]